MLLRRTVVGVAVGAVALSAAACSSGSSSKGASNSGSTTPSSAAPTSAAGSSSAAPSSSSGSASSSATASSSAPSGSAAPSGSGGAGSHGGVTLAQSAAISTSQGSKPLVVENNPNPSLQDNFNQFNGNGFGYKLNAEGLVYEPLLMFNDLKANTAYPWLATDFSWNSAGTAITFTIRPNVKFTDGTTLSPEDVAYTFQTMKDDPKANRSGLPVAGAKVVGSDKVEVDFTIPQFQNIYNIAGQTFIVEKKAYAGSGQAPDAWADPKPVGTGPYTLSNASAQGWVFKANPNYWGGKPPVPEVDIPAYSTNDVALQQLSAGKIDYAGNFVSQINQSFVAKDPAHHKYWFPAINVVSLWFNVSSGPKALQDPKVRQAISAAIDRTKVAQEAEEGYEAPATSSSGLLLPNFASLLPAQYKNDLKAHVDQATVDSIMKADGYAKDSKGFWAKGGQEVSFKIEDPTAYSDYYKASQIMSADFKAAGFNVTPNGVDPNKWYADLAAGTFDTAIHWSSTGPSPYATYDNWMDPALINGSNSTGDYGHFKDTTATQALADYAKAGDAQSAQTAVNSLAKVMNEQVPVAPIMYAAGWYEYNTKNYSGWVDKNNQYMDPSPNPANVAYVILHLKPGS